MHKKSKGELEKNQDQIKNDAKNRESTIADETKKTVLELYEAHLKFLEDKKNNESKNQNSSSKAEIVKMINENKYVKESEDLKNIFEQLFKLIDTYYTEEKFNKDKYKFFFNPLERFLYTFLTR